MVLIFAQPFEIGSQAISVSYTRGCCRVRNALLSCMPDGGRSFITEGSQRIDLHCATCGEESGEGADDEDSDDHSEVVGYVGGLDAIEEVGEQRSNSKTQEESGEEAGKDPCESVGEDHAQDLSARRADGHPDADFCGALRDGVREDTIDAARGEDERDHAEQGGQERGETALGMGAIDEELHGLDVGDGDVLVDGIDGVADGGFETRAGAGSVEDERHGGARRERVRNVDLRTNDGT